MSTTYSRITCREGERVPSEITLTRFAGKSGIELQITGRDFYIQLDRNESLRLIRDITLCFDGEYLEPID